MKFSDIVKQAVTLLHESQRMTYRALKREFDLDDEALEDLTGELIDAQRVAIDEDGKVLVWVGTAEEDKGQRITEEGETDKRIRDKGIKDKGIKEDTDNQDPSRWTPAHLAERIRATTVTDGERKTITALFADLKGSTALIEGLDPEEARAIIDPALQLMMDAVHQYDGYVAQALGDGIFALFGAPLAHEDHPQRALYAALRMQEAMRRYADTLRAKGYPPLQMRVGINTGEVVLRSIRKDDLHADYVPVGHSTNLAARMEQLANPGTIVVSAYTHRLTDGYFAFKDLGPTQIKGVEEPLNIYEVLSVGPLRTRLQVSARRGLTRFVGRQSEMEQLHKALEHAKAGQGQIVGTIGEPGLGKSRLFYEFKLTSQAGCLLLEAYSVSHGKATAYLPVIELLKSYFRIEVQDDERTRREKVTGKVLTLDRSLEDTLPYLFALLGIEEQPSPLQQMDAQIRRRRTFEALKKLLLRESLNQPLVLIFEDLHWIDSETQGFLDVLSESVASAKLLLLTNYRPEYRHEWGQKTYYTQLRLAPLGREDAEEFLDELLGEKGSPLPRRERARVRVMESDLHDLKQLILEKTQGTPFFMEEIVQELRERDLLSDPRRVGTAHLDVLPSTVQGILAARIDRLAPDEKALLQQLSVIGREFPLSLIRQVLTQSEAELYRLLASLQRKEFLYEQPAFPESEYVFKHALTQDVTYNSVLQERRKAWHEQTAQAIEGLYNTNLEEHYSDLAHHYRRSANTKKAIAYLQLAGQQAVQRSANTEAISHFTAALELLKVLPDTIERARQELGLQLALGVPLSALRGYGVPEVELAYSRARLLCQQVGDTPQLFPALRGLAAIYTIRGELLTVGELSAQSLSLAQRQRDPVPLFVAHYGLGLNWALRGESLLALHHLNESLAGYDPERHRDLAFTYAQDPKVFCLTHAATSLWLLGYPDQALHKSHEALRWAQELSHLPTLLYALTGDVWHYQMRRDVLLTRERVEAALTLCAEHELPNFLNQAKIVHGWVLAVQGKQDEGISQLRHGITAWRYAMGVVLRSPHSLALLAEAYGNAGQGEEGLRAITEALWLVEKSDERYYEAELYRIKGELTLQQESEEQRARGKKQKSENPNLNSQILKPNAHGEAEACFLKAIEIAQKQQAKSLELRATVSLVRLWQQQALGQSAKSKGVRAGSTEQETRTKLDAAHRMLSNIYNWFTEGFDTKDLQEAKALLGELSDRVIESLRD